METSFNGLRYVSIVRTQSAGRGKAAWYRLYPHVSVALAKHGAPHISVYTTPVISVSKRVASFQCNLAKRVSLQQCVNDKESFVTGLCRSY